jgi:hypothetical protein
MPISRLNVGRDNTIDLFDPNTGGIVSFGVITSFDAKQDTTDLKSKGMDGITRHGTEYDGWSGSIGIDRANANVDAFFAALEAAYFSGQNINSQTITQTIQEANGGVSQYRYIGVALKLDDAGNWQNGKFLGQKISWRASRRIRII